MIVCSHVISNFLYFCGQLNYRGNHGLFVYKNSDLSARNYKVFILPGEIKLSTDSIIGIAASEYLRRFNFTVGFFGTNGLHKEFGFTTPDINEAMVKTAAIERCKEVMILADDSKVGKVSQVTFCHDVEAKIITNQLIAGTEQAIITTLEDEL